MTLSITDDGDPITTATAFDVQESAEMGQVGQGTITVDDPDGTIDLVPHKLVRIGEDDCIDEVLFRGFGAAEDDVRGSRKTGAGRTITLNTLDMNAKAGFKVIRGRAWRKRPVESVGERLTDLLASPFIAVHDNGFVDYPSALVDGGDLRSMRPGDLLTDLATRVGFNWFIYWDEDETQASLWFKDSNTSTEYTSTLRISNVLTDIDGLTTFEASGDTAFHRDPTNLVSGVWMPFKKGNVYRTRAETEETYEPRDGTAPSSRTKRRARARNIADRYLEHHKTPEDRITTTVLLPSSRVNLIKAGHRIQARFSHLATQGYAEWTWFRVLHRKPSFLIAPKGRPELPDEPLYPVQLVLSPQEGVPTGDCVTTAAEVDIIQYKLANHVSSTTISFDDTPTPGNLLLLALGHRDELSLGPLPSFIAGWTQVPREGPEEFVFAQEGADSGTGYGHADLWWRICEAGDTGVETGTDCMKILMEFTPVCSAPIDAAKSDSSGNESASISQASGTPGVPALVVGAFTTRQTDTGVFAPSGSTNRIPPSGDYPIAEGTGHDRLLVLWKVSTDGAAVTLAGTQSGGTWDGYWWGGRIAGFEVLP